MHNLNQFGNNLTNDALIVRALKRKPGILEEVMKNGDTVQNRYTLIIFKFLKHERNALYYRCFDDKHLFWEIFNKTDFNF